MKRRSLDALEAEIRETRRRLGTLLARADRDYAVRAGLGAIKRMAGKPPDDNADGAAQRRPLAVAAALLAFAIGILGGRRAGRGAGSPPPESQGDKL